MNRGAKDFLKAVPIILMVAVVTSLVSAYVFRDKLEECCTCVCEEVSDEETK